jgi:APA family basic amino acid/polyamine antiporter
MQFSLSGAYMNVPAFVLVWICAFLLMRGARESVMINSIMVTIKLVLLVMFMVIAASSFDQVNFTPFLPFGVQGVSAAAGTIFFSYVGLDAVATASEEVVNPRRNIPIAIIGALVIVTAVYVGVAVAGLGAQPMSEFSGQQAGLAEILRKVTGTSVWPLVMAIGAVISVFSITLVTLYAQTRILFAISRDGLLPASFHRVDPRSQSPNFNVIVVAAVGSLIAGFVPATLLWDLVSIGTLVAFATVSAAVIILRRTRPDIQRAYSVPFYPYLPIASIGACFYIIFSLNGLVWVMFLGWVLLGGLYYFLYAARHSALEAK